MTPLASLALPPFRAANLLRSAHLMTVFGARARKESARLAALSTDRVVRIDDETRVRVRLTRPGAPRPTLVLVHGLVGDDSSPYMIGCAEKALAAGLDVARINLRNCGGTEALTTSVYHGGITADVAGTCRALVADGVEQLVVAGFSLGGGIVLRWAGELGEDVPEWLAGVVAVSPAVDFELAARACEAGRFARIYQRMFVASLKEILARKHELFPERFPDPRGVPIRTLREFDDRYTSRLSGFVGVEDYYAQASARPLLGRIRVPSAILAAQDDPLVPPASFDEVRGGALPAIRFIATEHGGHCGFVGARPAILAGQRDLDRFWAESRVVQLTRSLLQGAC